MPRPVVHPLRTPSGHLLTGARPADHPWHHGLGLGLPDVDGVNLWGGPSYVHPEGYLEARTRRGSVRAAGTGADAHEDLTWCDDEGAPLLRERRTVACTASGSGLSLRWRSVLTAARDLRLASPEANGRGGAGYGGLFWRLPAGLGADDLEVRCPHGVGEDLANGCTGAWLEIEHRGRWQARLEPDGDGTGPWFVRVSDYAGVGVSLAAPRARWLAAGESVECALALDVSEV
ncbi:DUF6807 family protein [Nocardioides bruguierae]|uniref:PmoA family protein n=1 Tax=Nocardioides bruguierae TaxID=2945102 RepID=A0A9X2DBC6_9ACTN|nr:DUF6807 family protein [Nocardioides bruguierae]MCM0622768.1 PmoA family protein [Nocardioides bruguierae]